MSAVTFATRRDCRCPADGPRPVVCRIDGDAGEETCLLSLNCAACNGIVWLHKSGEVEGEEIPLLLSQSTDDGGRIRYELTAPTEPEDVQELADVVDRIRNIGGLGS